MSERFDRIKKHLKENKKVYIVGGVGIIVGAVGALVLTRGDVKLTMDSWKGSWSVVDIQETLFDA